MLEILFPTTSKWGRAVAQWLKHYATNRQVAGSIPDVVIGIFQWHNPWPWGRLSLWQKWVSYVFPGVKAAVA
jgi:hypothetical protein